MKKLHIAVSPLTGTIFAGTVLKDGMTWGVNKQDVTIEALVAVAEHALKFGKPVEISKADGTPEYRITVEKLTPNA
jgi:molybdopterin biosynthesis enzyme MoaB